MASELRRGRARDRWLLDLLSHHQVFTTQQITNLAFDNVHTARNRMTLLQKRGFVAQFRNGVRPGSEQLRWTLDLVGYTWLASRDGMPLPKFPTVQERINRLASSPKLAHLLAVNELFTELVCYARSHGDAQLSAWWSEQQCTAVTGTLLRPDGHGTWTEADRMVPFWFEHDNGSEPMHKVVAKLDNYLTLQRETGLGEAVLFRFDTPGREESFHRNTVNHPALADGMLVATSHGEQHPAGPIWRPIGNETAQRLRLAALTGHTSR